MRGRWDERVEKIAALIKPGESVLDVGAGEKTLRAMIPKSRYASADKEPGHDYTWDLEGAWWPKETYDAAVLSGVLEHVADPVRALRLVSRVARRAVVSYDHGGSLRYRRKLGFKSHLSRAGIEEAFEAAGWRHRAAGTWRSQVIYALTK